ncbi:MAG: tetratricopeptide (TPR) repeat protein [Saprospiraceae bacterium]
MGLWIIVLLSLSFSTSQAQKDPLKEGNVAYEEDNYREALVYYNQIDKIENSAPILFKRGVCYYELNQLDRGAVDFQRAYEYGYKNPLVDYYTGLIQHHKGNFQQATNYYKNYLRETPIDNADRNRVRQLIKQCGRAIDLSYMRPIAIVERGPNIINTVYDEIGMIESPSVVGRYYYTSNKPNTSLTMSASDYDIYSINQIDNEWMEPKRLPYSVNRGDEDILLGFTKNADGIYLFRGKDFEGDLCLNSGSGDRQGTKKLPIPSAFNLSTNDAYFYDDHLVIFSSRLPNGYGGYDLYASIREDSKWGEPLNLGPEINSPQDELSPFLSKDGSELYYSSDRYESIGGLDIFYSTYLYEANKWAAPENLGIPINSPGDDVNFTLSFNGLTGTFSSNRKNAYGGKDIYIARFKVPRGQQSFTTDYLPFVDYHISDDGFVTSEKTNELEESFEQEDTLLEDLIKDTAELVIEELATEELIVEELVVEDSVELDSIALNTEGLVVSNESEIDDALTKTPERIEVINTPIQYNISPLFYESRLDLSDKRTQATISQLNSILNENPGLKLEIQCHSSQDGILEFKLFSSVKLAEKLQKALIAGGIEDRRLHVSGQADNYPLALFKRNVSDAVESSQYNSRIEFKFYDYDQQLLQINRTAPDIPVYNISTKYDLYRALSDDAINYKIQVAIIGQMYRGLALDLFNDASVEEDEITGLYMYTIGLYDTYSEALQTRRDIERLGITDAKVLPYYDGRLLPDDQLAFYVNDYPDLRNFMNYGN